MSSTLLKSGDVVTVSYSYLAQGKPIEARITKLRSELTWSEVSGEKSKDAPHLAIPPSRQPFGHWSTNTQNIREFFGNLAAKLGFDPLVSKNWYSVNTETVRAEKVSLRVHFEQ